MPDQLALLLREQPFGTRRLLARTRRLRTGLPTVWDAHRAGDLDADQVRVIDRIARRVTEPHTLAAIDDQVVDAAQTRSPKQLGALAAAAGGPARTARLRRTAPAGAGRPAGHHQPRRRRHGLRDRGDLRRRRRPDRHPARRHREKPRRRRPPQLPATPRRPVHRPAAGPPPARRRATRQRRDRRQRRRRRIDGRRCRGGRRGRRRQRGGRLGESASRPAGWRSRTSTPTPGNCSAPTANPSTPPANPPASRCRRTVRAAVPAGVPAAAANRPDRRSWCPLSSLLGLSRHPRRTRRPVRHDARRPDPGPDRRHPRRQPRRPDPRDQILFTRLLTDDGGRLLDTTELGRFPSRRLAEAIRLRAGTCCHPTCTVPAALCDIDHHHPHPDGPTAGHNCDPACRRHHRGITFAWQAAVRDHDGVDWTMPDAERYRCTDEPLPV